nr:glycerophosphodiester phosphodiesterase gdpdl4 [Quercus suber]
MATIRMFTPPGFWLNIQNDQFFAQHNLSMRSFILSVSLSVIVNYISPPENLKFVKTFASVNLVLKAYLWHVDETDYLPGHEEELEDFANDVPLSVKAIDFFAHLDQNASAQVNPLVISKYGTSEDYPGGSGVQNHLQLFCTGHCRDQGTLEAERR